MMLGYAVNVFSVILSEIRTENTFHIVRMVNPALAVSIHLHLFEFLLMFQKPFACLDEVVRAILKRNNNTRLSIIYQFGSIYPVGCNDRNS